MKFIFKYVHVQLCQHHLFERLIPFPIELLWLVCQKSINQLCLNPFLIFFSVPSILFLCQNSPVLSLQLSKSSKQVLCFSTFFFIKIVLLFLGCLYYFDFHKKMLIGIYVSLFISVVRTDILKNFAFWFMSMIHMLMKK